MKAGFGFDVPWQLSRLKSYNMYYSTSMGSKVVHRLLTNLLIAEWLMISTLCARNVAFLLSHKLNGCINYGIVEACGITLPWTVCILYVCGMYVYM